ncbi:hypothetical protein KDU71_10655 [Carboxylicivirga sediminis]|uniref:Transglutaminase-like domain-containing protein n=1 Tax=Carboxylicivirga sediminis TaxID=2006564 RepID=A0A941F418_9BACT|nr:hypothetical protein [Carboxylicivirga sediminis]MBR8536019.1 hypothetical protein [Carboxylicivirga sediminis]
MKRLLLLLCVLTGLLFVAEGQIDKEDPFKKMDDKYNARLNQMNQDYEATLKRMQEEYDAHLKQMNVAFKRYLRKGFEEVVQTPPEVKPVEVPKPIEQPKYEPDVAEVKPADKLEPVVAPPPVKPEVVIAEAAAYSISPIYRIPEGTEPYSSNISVDFFGSIAPLVIDKRMRNLSLSSVKPNAFAAYWDDFTATYYQVYIESLVNYAEEKNLNDWGIYQLVDKTAAQIYSSANSRVMWSWAMLNQAGYQAKIGYSGSSVYLLLPFMQEVYEKPYYSIDGSNFYLMSNKKGISNMMTYTENFGGASKKIDLHLPFALNYTNESNTVVRKTTLPNETEPLQLKMDKTVMAFLNSYPQTVNTVYLNAAMSASVKETLYDYMAPRLQGKNETQAVTYLLNYLHSFEYKTDRDQFNREKMFFPDELFYYPYSDCEDRAVLFTRLVNELLGLDAVALTYFSHMAAAVAFSEPVEGYSILVDGRRYTITDPTYINAPIGSVMPEYEKYTPLAIKINNDSRLNNIWQMIARSVEQGNEGNIFIADRTVAENGKFMVSGWFSNTVTVGNRDYAAYGGTRDLWFATFDQGGSLEWFQPVGCTDNLFTQAFNVGKEGNVYALINYTGSVNINRREVARSDKAAHLILGLSNRAQPILSENLTFEAPEGKKLAFYGKYKADGTKIDLLSFPTDKVNFEPKITVDSRNEVVVRGVVGEIEGLTKDVPIMLSSATFSAEDQIESYMNNYSQQDVNRHMVALFSTLQLLSQNGGRISGITVRNLMNKHNPEFYKNNPDVYKSLLSMQFVINDGGVVKVETYKGRNVSLFSMKIKNNSNLQITRPEDNAYLVKCLNGVQVGKAIVWYDLNSIALAPNGEMVFDYDTDHTKRTVSIDEIIN